MTITGWLRISGIRWVRFSGTHRLDATVPILEPGIPSETSVNGWYMVTLNRRAPVPAFAIYLRRGPRSSIG